MENKDNLDFANCIALALNQYCLHVPMNIQHQQPYKFSMMVVFDFENTKLKSLSVCDVQLKKMNKSLNKIVKAKREEKANR